MYGKAKKYFEVTLLSRLYNTKLPNTWGSATHAAAILNYIFTLHLQGQAEVNKVFTKKKHKDIINMRFLEFIVELKVEACI